MHSLRRTALLWMTAVITGVGLAGAGLAYWEALNEANGFMDLQLRQIARSVGATPGLHELPSMRHDPEDDVIVQVWDAADRLANAGEHAAIPRQSGTGFATVEVGGIAWQVFTVRDATGTIQVSQQVEVRRELAERAALQVVVPLLVLVPVGCLVVGWAMGRALGDLRRLAAHIEGLPAGSRDPIAVERVPSEAVPLVSAMNRLIERLRESLSQQREFLSDAAHELRTPLTALDLQINNLAKADAASLPRLLADARQGARRATTLVDQLLRIARFDAAADGPETRALDLRGILLQAIADHAVLAESRAVDLGLVAAVPAPFVGSERELRTLFGNLIDNAVKYTPRGGTVDVGLACGQGLVSVEIVDTGPGLAPELLDRVFDRFFRAASADVEGSGLGLAIALAIAGRHAMALQIANRTDRSGLRVTVTGRAVPGAPA